MRQCGLGLPPFALFRDKPRAREVLQAEVDAGGTAGFESEIAFREFDAGRLNMTWQPPEGCNTAGCPTTPGRGRSAEGFERVEC